MTEVHDAGCHIGGPTQRRRVHGLDRPDSVFLSLAQLYSYVAESVSSSGTSGMRRVMCSCKQSAMYEVSVALVDWLVSAHMLARRVRMLLLHPRPIRSHIYIHSIVQAIGLVINEHVLRWEELIWVPGLAAVA